jgi:hypothetical protein
MIDKRNSNFLANTWYNIYYTFRESNFKNKFSNLQSTERGLLCRFENSSASSSQYRG